MTALHDPLSIFLAWLPWYAFGITAEIPIFAMLGRVLTRRQEERPSIPRLILAGAVGTVITYPLFVFVWPHVTSSYLTWAVTGELLVVVIETVSFRLVAGRIDWWKAGLCSLGANGFSLLVSLFLR